MKHSSESSDSIHTSDDSVEGSWYLPPLAESVELDLGPRREARLDSFLARDGLRKTLERAYRPDGQLKPDQK